MRRRHALGPRILPTGLPVGEAFALAAAGFTGMELTPVSDPAERRAVTEAMASTGVQVSSIEAGHPHGPALLDREGEELEANVALTERAIRQAAEWGAESVLVVSGRIDAETPAEVSWARSAEVLATRLVPLAEDLGVSIGIENTWHTYLLTAHELVRFVDEQDSPAVGAYFDPGNVIFGNPEHWVPVLGDRIVGVHYKDHSLLRWAEMGVARFAMVGSGSVDWTRLDLVLAEVGYTGWLTHPLVPPPLAVKVVERVDRVIAGWTTALTDQLDRLRIRRVEEMGRRAHARDVQLTRSLASAGR